MQLTHHHHMANFVVCAKEVCMRLFAFWNYMTQKEAQQFNPALILI
jgi:hypothetical protein